MSWPRSVVLMVPACAILLSGAGLADGGIANEDGGKSLRVGPPILEAQRDFAPGKPEKFLPSFGPVVGPLDVVAAGAGLRNQGAGQITLPAFHGTVVKAFLYWTLLSPAPTPNANIAFLDGNGVAGALIGTGSDLCWGGGAAWSYRADVTSQVSAGGVHSVQIASADVGGADPWVSGSSTPMAEGASLVVVYASPANGMQEVVIVDGYESGTVEIQIPHASPSSAQGTLTVLGADGQTNGGDQMYWNGGLFAAGTWDGSDPQLWPAYSFGSLWDTDTFPVFVVPPASVLRIAKLSDCIGPVAAILVAPA